MAVKTFAEEAAEALKKKKDLKTMKVAEVDVVNFTTSMIEEHGLEDLAIKAEIARDQYPQSSQTFAALNLLMQACGVVINSNNGDKQRLKSS